MCLIVLAGAGAYTYFKFNEFNRARAAIVTNKTLIEQLRAEEISAKGDFESQKEEFIKLNSEINEKLEFIFPETNQYTVLTKQLDSFEEELTSKSNPFEVSSIEYQEVQEREHSSILPFRMNIMSSPANFTKFLHLMETSGSLVDQVRLMDITSIRLNFQDAEEDGKKIKNINFTVQVNAYFQKTE